MNALRVLPQHEELPAKALCHDSLGAVACSLKSATLPWYCNRQSMALYRVSTGSQCHYGGFAHTVSVTI